jgi:N-acetylglutamate synthase-like GNAT family acetyltransferase
MHPDQQAQRDERIRRARREDIPALLHLVGGPEAGRVRALRRLTKTLTADLYVLDRASAVQGAVAVIYRRSLAHGGLTATIDTIAAWPHEDTGERAHRDTAALLACAIARARRRGCVAIDTALQRTELRAALEAEGFIPGALQLVLDLRADAAAAARNPS